MSGTIDSHNEANRKLLTEIVERNKGRAIFELFGFLPEKQVGIVSRTFLYKGKKFLVILRDAKDGE